jgi:hypothetical protein
MDPVRSALLRAQQITLEADMMLQHDNHIAYLKSLAPAALNSALKQELTDSLQELVACIEQSLPQPGNTLHGCVIDDFQVQRIDIDEHACRVPIRFSASARDGTGPSKHLECIAGRAEAVIHEDSHITFQGVGFAEDQIFIAPDVGGGD